MWLAHALTLSRLPIAVGLVWSYGHTLWAVVLVLLAAATDIADGNVARYARKRGGKGPEIGAWLDPLVDKLFVVIVLATIWWHTRDLVLIGLIAAREVVLVPLVIVYLVRKQPTSHLRADPVGKAATVAQFIACAVAVAEPRWALPIAAVAAVLGLAAVVHYIVRELRSTTSSAPPSAPPAAVASQG